MGLGPPDRRTFEKGALRFIGNRDRNLPLCMRKMIHAEDNIFRADTREKVSFVLACLSISC